MHQTFKQPFLTLNTVVKFFYFNNYTEGFGTLGLLDGKVVGHNVIIRLSAFSFRFGNERSKDYRIDTNYYKFSDTKGIF